VLEVSTHQDRKAGLLGNIAFSSDVLWVCPLGNLGCQSGFRGIQRATLFAWWSHSCQLWESVRTVLFVSQAKKLTLEPT